MHDSTQRGLLGLVSLVILVLVVFVGSTIQGSLGYGLGLLSVPAFLLLEPEFIPAVPLLLSIPVIVLSLIRDRQSVDVISFFSLSLGSVPGTAVGSLLLVGLSAFGVKILAVSVFVVVALLTVFGPKQAFANTAGKVGSGFISSFMGSTTGAGGPILALSFRDVEPSVLRGTLNATGLVAGVFGLVGSAIADRLGTSQLIGAAVFLLPALIGVLLSRVVNKFVMKDRLATIVNVSIVLCCVAVVVQVIAEAVIKFV